MRPKPWRCGECGAALAGDADVEEHFLAHPVPPGAVPPARCKHGPLAVNVTPSRVYLWVRAEGAEDPALGTHLGWSRRAAPAALREVVERENGSNLTVPGLYYPHSRPSGQGLEAVYHEIVREDAAARPSRSASAAAIAPPRFTRGVRDDASRKRRARAAAAGELAGGIVAGVIGANLMYACTQYVPFDGCAEHGYGLYGLLILFPGVCIALVGLASFLATIGKEPGVLPEGWRPGGPHVSPELSAGVERIAAVVWGAILLAVLLVVEALPTYNLVLLTQSGRNPTFNLGAFLADMVFFVVADLIVVFLVVTYTAND